MLVSICLARETGSRTFAIDGDAGGKYQKSSLRMHISGDHQWRQGSVADLVLYVEALQKPIGVSTAQPSSRWSPHLPEAITPCHQPVHIRVIDDHGHACFDAQKDWV